MKFRKKPVVVEAHQWFQNGDHPDDDCHMIDSGEPHAPPWKSEGKIVRRFRHPNVAGDAPCSECGQVFDHHGWIDTLEDGHRVCPGDWIITGVVGERYPCKPHVFAATYEPVEETR